MLQAQLYFLSDQYYQDFPDDKLMKNKDTINGMPHSRPCFFAFQHNSDIGIMLKCKQQIRIISHKEQDITRG